MIEILSGKHVPTPCELSVLYKMVSEVLSTVEEASFFLILIEMTRDVKTFHPCAIGCHMAVSEVVAMVNRSYNSGLQLR